jgi:hypothetical protein
MVSGHFVHAEDIAEIFLHPTEEHFAGGLFHFEKFLWQSLHEVKHSAKVITEIRPALCYHLVWALILLMRLPLSFTRHSKFWLTFQC